MNANCNKIIVNSHTAVADSLSWFSRPKPRLVQSRLALNSYLYITPIQLDVKGESLLRRQAHLLQRLHPDGMADEFLYNIIIGHHLSNINGKNTRMDYLRVKT